jgi:hypothetical protein
LRIEGYVGECEGLLIAPHVELRAPEWTGIGPGLAFGLPTLFAHGKKIEGLILERVTVTFAAGEFAKVEIACALCETGAVEAGSEPPDRSGASASEENEN